MRRIFLAKLTHGDPQAAMPWLRLLAVTTYTSPPLVWDGFRSLYRNHFDFAATPQILHDYECMSTCRILELDFASDHNRVQKFSYFNVGEAIDDHTQACLSTLVRGEGTT